MSEDIHNYLLNIFSSLKMIFRTYFLHIYFKVHYCAVIEITFNSKEIKNFKFKVLRLNIKYFK